MPDEMELAAILMGLIDFAQLVLTMLILRKLTKWERLRWRDRAGRA